jgi:hypothetical protein
MWEVAWSDAILTPEEKELLIEQAEGYGGPILRAEVTTWLKGRRPPAPNLAVLRREPEAVLREAARMVMADHLIVDDERAVFTQIKNLLEDEPS